MTGATVAMRLASRLGASVARDRRDVAGSPAARGARFDVAEGAGEVGIAGGS
jgi:hypothetical protein